MSFMNTLKDKLGMTKGKAEDYAAQHPDKVDKGIDQAGRTADAKTGGKHGDRIDSGTEKAKDSLHDRQDRPQNDGGGI